MNRDHRTAPSTEGERWARAELGRLRAASFAPRATAAFLGAALARSRELRAARPAVARRARRWLWVGAAAYGVKATRRSVPARPALVHELLWWGAVGAMLEWHLGMVETEAGEPRNLGPADALTLTRAWLTPLIADDLGPAVVLTAAATDVLDGVAARATAPTRAGRDLEGMVDAAVLAAALLGARRRDELSGTAVKLEVARLSAGVVYGTIAYFDRLGPPDPRVMRAGRATAPLRVGALLAAGRGRRRVASALLVTGSLLGAAGLVPAIRSPARVTPAPGRP